MTKITTTTTPFGKLKDNVFLEKKKHVQLILGMSLK